MDEQQEAIEYGYPEHFWLRTTINLAGITTTKCVCGEEWSAPEEETCDWALSFHVELAEA